MCDNILDVRISPVSSPIYFANMSRHLINVNIVFAGTINSRE